MRNSKVVFVKALAKKVKLYKGRLDCYFMDKVEAEQHRNGYDGRQALMLIIGVPRLPYMTYVRLPLPSKELRAYLDMPSDPL